jgi:hypothetical protein
MFPESSTIFDIRLMEKRRQVALATHRAELMVDSAGSGYWTRVRALCRSLVYALANAIPDSRDHFRTKELDLATYGVTWNDAATDRQLALELRAAMRRRHALAACPPSLDDASLRPSLFRAFRPQFGR